MNAELENCKDLKQRQRSFNKERLRERERERERRQTNLLNASNLFDERRFVVNLGVGVERHRLLVGDTSPENPLRNCHQLSGTGHDPGINDTTQCVSAHLLINNNSKI
jgi:hypothetical protein